MKKVLSLVLVISMVLSSMSFAFASTFEDIADSDYAKAIETLTALGVVTGYEDGTYRPENTVTRAEMAKLMVELLGYGDLVTGSKSNFTDTQGHWADPWIAIAAGRNIVIGTGDGKFTPDKQVTYDEVLTMLVRGLGYTDSSNEIKSMSWPTNFKVKAAELGITDGVTMTTTGADRGGVAQAMYNALEAVLVTVNTDGDVVKTEDSDGEYVELLSRIAELDDDFDVTTEVLDPDNSNYAGDYVDMAPYMFQNLDVYLNDDDEVVYVRDTNSLVIEGKVDEVVDDELTVETTAGKDVDIVFEDLDIDSSILFENGALKESDIELVDLEDTETIKVVANDDKDLGGDGDGKVDEDEIVGFVTTLRTDVVRIENEYVDGNDSLDGIDLPLDDDEVDLANITVTGAVESLEDIKEDDVVIVYESEDETAVILVVSRDTVEGKITRVNDDDEVYFIDGAEYDLGSLYIGSVLALGDEGVFYLDQFGEIVDYDGESAGPTDYAVVIGSESGNIDVEFGEWSVDDYPRLKLATQDGEEIAYEIDVDVNSDGDEIEDPAEYDDGDPLVELDVEVDGDDEIVGGDLNIIGDLASSDDFLIKYKLNADERITEIEVIENLTDFFDDNTTEIDLEKSTNEFATDAIVFDAGDDYSTADVEDLPSDVIAYVVRNSSGDIEVLVAATDEIDKASDVIFAYIYGLDEAYDDNGDEIQTVEVYTDDSDTEKDTDADDVVRASDVEGVFAIDYDGEVIDEAYAVTIPTSATTGTAFEIDGEEAGIIFRGTADDVNASRGWITINGDMLPLSDHGTVVLMEDIDEADELGDLYDIDEDETEIVVYINSDDEIDLILVLPEDVTEEEDDTAEGTVDYINSSGTKITVDGTIYTLDEDTILYDEDENIVAIGYEDIKDEITGAEVKDIEVRSGVVVSLVIVD